MIQHDSGITTKQIENEYNKEKLLRWKEAIDEDIVQLGIQIDEAKTKQQATGEYADHNWFHKVRTKKKLYGFLSRKIQSQLSIVNDRKDKNFNQQFLNVCHRELDHDLLEELKAKARAEIQNDMYEYVEQNYL